MVSVCEVSVESIITCGNNGRLDHGRRPVRVNRLEQGDGRGDMRACHGYSGLELVRVTLGCQDAHSRGSYVGPSSKHKQRSQDAWPKLEHTMIFPVMFSDPRISTSELMQERRLCYLIITLSVLNGKSSYLFSTLANLGASRGPATPTHPLTQ
jgi:hypothetical protein